MIYHHSTKEEREGIENPINTHHSQEILNKRNYIIVSFNDITLLSMESKSKAPEANFTNFKMALNLTSLSIKIIK